MGNGGHSSAIPNQERRRVQAATQKINDYGREEGLQVERYSRPGDIRYDVVAGRLRCIDLSFRIPALGVGH